MRPSHRVTIHWRQEGRVISHEVPEGDYILQSFEQQGDPCPFPAGTAVAPAVLCARRGTGSTRGDGALEKLRAQGYGLLCVARAIGPLVAETQDEDEVYELQFGRHFGRGQVTSGLR